MAVEPDQPEIAYGVWLRGEGWLRTPKGDPFTDLSREVALGAASFFGRRARVVPFDDAMLELERKFLDGERGLIHALGRLFKREAQG